MSALSPFSEVEFAEPTGTMRYAEESALEDWESPFAEAAPFGPESEQLLGDEAEEEEFDFGEAEQETAHPILSMFPLPAAVIEALSSGLSSLAVGLAAGAGFKDVNQLTNIVFYFRHPEMIGRKIGPEQRDLAAEWVGIRDRVVKPALQSPVPTAPAPSSPVATPVPADLSSSRLMWPEGATEEQAFMRAVYDHHAKHSREAGAGFVADLPASALASIEGKQARKDAAEAAKVLLAEARAALAAEGLADKIHIGIISAYRPATRQFEIWQGRTFDGKRSGGGFPHYYKEAIAKGVIPKGDFSPAAVAKMAHYLGGVIASPGYSNHQDGLAFDFGTEQVGKSLRKLGWKAWFRKWLVNNAPRHHFRPLPREAWHWTYHPPSSGQSEVWSEEVAAPAGVRAGKVKVDRVPLLSSHRGKAPDLILRWNDMPSVPDEIDVVVHLHGFWYPGLELTRDIEPVSGLDLTPIKGESGQGRTRPTLTVLPRAHYTGVKQTHGSYYAYTFPALIKKEGLPELLRFSLERFAAEVQGTPPRVGRLILTAHSGGGKALLAILKHHDPHQVHVFDALYWSPDALVEWVRRRIRNDRAALQAAGAPSAREYLASQRGALRVFYQGRYKGGTRPYSLKLRNELSAELGAELRDWYRVEASKYDHFQIPRRYGWRVLADASADVPDAYVEQTQRRQEVSELDFEASAFEEPASEESAFEELAVFEEPAFEEPELEDLHGDGDFAEIFDEEDEELAAGDALESDEEAWYEREPELLVSDADEAEDLEDFDLGEELEFALGEDFTSAGVEEADEWGIESPEVEHGEAQALPADGFAGELDFEQETATTVAFPSGATLNVVTGPTGPGEEHYDPNGSGNPLLDTSQSVRATRLSASFTVGELAHSGGKSFEKSRIDPELVRSLQRLRDHVGKSVRVTSGYRPYLYNVDLYTNKYKKKPTLSRHSGGQAADVKIAGMTGMDIAKMAIDVLGPNIAVGIGGDYAHVDVRGQWARWTYFTDKQQNERAVAEIDGYRRQRAGAGAPAVPAATTTNGKPPEGAAIQMVEAIGRGLWDTAVRIAIGTGVTDANQLTNTLFYLKHPELRGQKIGAEQHDLAREWVEIRDRWVKPALASHPAAPAQPQSPATPSTTTVRLKRVKKGYAAYGGGRLDAALRRLVQSGALTISERDIDTLQRIADVESSGLTNALNSWDSAVMSAGFKQWTLRWGELQDLISRAPEAFARHGIRLAPSGTNYVFATKGKPQPAIDGVPDWNTLRNEDWGRRFFLAGLEPEAVAAAARKALEDIAKVEQHVRKTSGWTPHFESPRGRALLVELDNNRPAYLKDVLPRVLAQAKAQPQLDENAFLQIFAAEIAASYERHERDGEKGRRWTKKIMSR